MNERDDERMLDTLRATVAMTDPVPGHVVEAARAAFGWRLLDAELAALIYDSAIQDQVLVGVRGDEGPRSLTFETPEVSIEIEVHTEAGEHRRIVGQLAPPQPATLEVVHPDGVEQAEADEHGRFVVPRVRPGPVRLRCWLNDGPVVQTEWTAL